jgi:hypothetical protein
MKLYVHTFLMSLKTNARLLFGDSAFFYFFCARGWVAIRVTRDRGYDFLNIFSEKFSEKIGVFDSKQS